MGSKGHSQTVKGSHIHTHTHLWFPGHGFLPEQFESAGVLGLDPARWHQQVSIRLGHHHQVGHLYDAPLDALQKPEGSVTSSRPLTVTGHTSHV